MKFKKDVDKKIVGYVLLVAGLCIMGYSIYSVFNVFGGGDASFELLVYEPEDTNQTSSGDIDLTNMSVSGINLNLEQAMAPLYPMFNLLIWLSIAFFLVVAGGRVSSLGIKMLKASVPDVKIVKPEKPYKLEKKEKNIDVEEIKKEIEQK